MPENTENLQFQEELRKLDRNIYFYANLSFEHWDFTNPLIKGIGGSEISQIEMSSRLAQRHHNVVSYAPVPWHKEQMYKIHRNAKWVYFEDCTFKEPGIWIIYRVPSALDNFPKAEDNKDQEVWFVSQDVFYTEPGNEMNEDRASKIHKFICLCSDHINYVHYRCPYLEGKTVRSSNGINVDLINAVPQNNKIERNPYRMIYTSSPDRGLEQLIPIFRKAKEFIPELELHIFYGFDNIDKIIKHMPWVKNVKDSIMSKVQGTDGIFWHGRVGQVELLAEWYKSGIWCYPINFTETSCISCMEAQACGTIPVVSPVWALRENVMHGIFVEGDAKEPVIQNYFAGEIIRLCMQSELREKILHEGGDMQMEAKLRFNWERFVDQWESWIYFPEREYGYPIAQYMFQHKYAKGKILNIGADNDSSGLRQLLGADNLDVQPHKSGVTNIIGNILQSNILKLIGGKYDTVIMGDIIEHMTEEQGIFALTNAAYGLKDRNSRMIITCPSDPRTKEEQNPDMKGDEKYFGGVSQFHRHINLKELEEIISAARLTIERVQVIDYTHFKGYGVICHV